MVILQRVVTLRGYRRGVHCITEHIYQQLPELQQIQQGILHLFLQHTSAALTLGENTDPRVREDLAEHLERLVPDDIRLYRHTVEGAEDASSHVKSVLIGASLVLPVSSGKLALGTWQGIYLCEFRSRVSQRMIVATLIGV